MSPTTAPILARLNPQVLAEGTLPTEIMAFPAGTNTINASQSGKPITKTILVGPDTADAMNTALKAHLTASPQKPYFDFDHDDTRASAWPQSYRWEPGTSEKPAGVYAAVEWSASGSGAVLGKDYRSFSPAFHVDESKPARVIGAPLNMGGLVNAPAFRKQAPIWAADTDPTLSAALPLNPNQNPSTMTEAETQAAAAAANADALKAKETVTALTTKVEALLAKETARVKSDAATKVAAAVKRGALPAKDETIQAKWRGLIEADASHGELLDSMAGSGLLNNVTSPGGHIVVKAGAVEVLKAYSEAKTSLDRAAIYAKDISPLFSEGGFSLGPILAANSLGTLSTSLVVQRALTLLKFSYPWLQKITTDFSPENAAFNQAIITRLKGALVANAFVAGTGYGANNAGTTDVSVTLNQHVGVPVTFNVNELASTTRDLFGEQAEGMHYAIGTKIVDYLFTLLTAANFTNHTDSKLSLFNRSKMTAMAKALGNRKVGQMGRFTLLNPDFFEKLGQDSSLVQLAAYQKPEYLTEYRLPRVAGFDPFEAQSLPANAEDLAGFSGTSESLALVTRVPNDYAAALPGASNGTVSTVTNIDTGISVQLVQFVDHVKAEANARVALMFGAAKGNPACGERLVVLAEA